MSGRYIPRVVGASQHEEYWISAEDLEEFNRNLLAPITVTAEFKPE
jgi:hypothetical protein